jgi:WD40 repeat protein
MHRAPITAIKPSRNGHFIVTGCKDSTVRVWAHANNEMTLKATLCGHDESKITSIDVNTTFGTIVTGDAHGKVLTWDLRTFGFLRQLHHDFKSKLSDKNGNKNTFVGASKSVLSVSINDRTGDILTLIGCNLTLFDINGNIVARLVAQELFSENDLPSCAISTNCPEWMEEGIVAVTGHKNGEIVLWGADRDSELLILRHIVQEKAHSCPITCLRIDEERQGTLLVGDKSGKMSVCKSLKLEDLNPQELALIVEDLESYQQT